MHVDNPAECSWRDHPSQPCPSPARFVVVIGDNVLTACRNHAWDAIDLRPIATIKRLSNGEIVSCRCGELLPSQRCNLRAVWVIQERTGFRHLVCDWHKPRVTQVALARAQRRGCSSRITVSRLPFWVPA